MTFFFRGARVGFGVRYSHAQSRVDGATVQMLLGIVMIDAVKAAQAGLDILFQAALAFRDEVRVPP